MRVTGVALPPLKWRESPNVSVRRLPVRMVVVHRPVGGYEGSIEALCNPAHAASAHVIVKEDGSEATQLVAWQRKAWACVTFNSPSDNIETPDWIWTGPLTADALRVMHVCARIVAFRLYKRGFPAVWLRGGALIHGRGFTRHIDLGALGGGHSDPTQDVHRWQVFAGLVAHELARGGFPLQWGRRGTTFANA